MRMRYLFIFSVMAIETSVEAAATYRLADVTVVTTPDAPAMVKLAADEIRAYVYRLTGVWPAQRRTESVPAMGPVIIVGMGHRPRAGRDPTQSFRLSVDHHGRQIVEGASPRATLWAAYHLIEHWGVGFYLGGDAVPPRNSDRHVALVTDAQTPTLVIRGNLPWFNFLNSPTTWNPQDYKTFFGQMAKQKANLIMFHAYDHEPFCGYDITDTSVTRGGPLMTTISEHRWWSPHAMSTRDHLFGTDRFFDRGEWGCEVGIEDAWTFAPGRATRWQQQMMADALRYARSLGIETCLGFEVSGDPLDQQVRAALRKRITYVLNKYPLDYLGIWQAENLGVRGATGSRRADQGRDANALWNAFGYLGNPRQQVEGVRMARHVRLAYQIMKKIKPDVRMVVSGWGGDQHMKFTSYYPGLDRVVPRDIIFAALDNIDPRSADHVSMAYGKLSPGRTSWPIPWFESDGGHTRIDQTGPQTNVTAFEPLLKDIVKKGCAGALGIHWRTRNVEDVAGYLYRFAWDPRLTAAAFFRRYAGDQYGANAAERMAKVHLRLEEFGPQYVGARGTTECGSKRFRWFTGGRDPMLNHGPNHAGSLPAVERFAELDSLRRSLLQQAARAAGAGRQHAAMQYGDLARTIEWLVKRARVGLAIWGPDAPLEKRLREAERLFGEGRVGPARQAAREVLVKLEREDFRGALRALATTCRTRGELGMLTTANARYGRYYATFVQRITHILGETPPAARYHGPWSGPPVRTVFPVPNWVSPADKVSFDAVVLPAVSGTRYQVALRRLEGAGPPRTLVPLTCCGGAYDRAVFTPPGPGVWAWRLEATGGAATPNDNTPPAEGVLTVVDTR